MDELSEDDKLTVARARKIQRFFSQPFQVAEVFTGHPGKFVALKDTIRGFQMILNGELDHIPEVAFYMVGPIEEVFQKADKLSGQQTGMPDSKKAEKRKPKPAKKAAVAE